MDEHQMRLRSKLPGADTGITIKKTMCDICSPGLQCGVDAYVKDCAVIKLEGTDGFPVSDGRLCTRGAAGRQYLYREDRIRRPMKRVGPRGSGEFEPISWEEALDICARELKKQRAVDPDGVAWMTGYAKWYRPYLHRLAHSFGTRNYLTESSTCHRAEVMSYKATFGKLMRAGPAGANTVIAWGVNAPVNAYPLGKTLMDLHARGGTIVVVDPRNTHSAQLMADIHLRPRAGTDAALAHGVARCILENGWQDQAFLDRYVHGFRAYRDYVWSFTPERVQKITGVPAADIRRLAEILAGDPTAVVIPSNALTHRVNGFNTHRAVICLMVLLGRIGDTPGYIPDNDSYIHSDGGFVSLEEAFIQETRPAGAKTPIGWERFPLWGDLVDEGQMMDLVRQCEEGTPYPVRVMACFGVNDRMFPESPRFLAAMDKMEFTFAADIFWTDVCRHADIVLPVCTSYERGEAKCYAGRFVNFTRPAIEPLYESRPDTDIICELARRLELGDARLEAGYEACAEYILSPSGITDWEAVKDADLPTPAPNARKYVPGSYLENIETPSGKIELYSEMAAKYENRGLRGLPEYVPEENPSEYPFTLISGARLPHTLHSRLHDVPWLRSLRPEPMADMNPADGEMLGIGQGEDILLETSVGSIRVKANLTELTSPGEIQMIHGYREANVNAILPMEHLDPYTGFPGYKQVPCAVRKVVEA